MRPSGLPDNSAELGASIVRHDAVSDQFSASIATRNGARAIVLETSLDFAPGAFAVVAVTRDAKRGDVGANRIDADWPSPAKSEAAMSKDGAFSSSGFLTRDVDELLDPSVSVSLETVVCRGLETKVPGVVDYRVTTRTGDEIVAQERRALRVGAPTERR